jgi:predicted nucleic acid-binding protein
VKYFYDASVLLPAFLEDHEHHEPSLRAFLKADKKLGCCAAHTLAELYATFTRLPGKHRLSGDQALLFLENVRERLTIITLSAEEYFLAMKESAAAGIVGGTVYDALLARCALRAGAEVLYTWNTKHFQQFAPQVAKKVKIPE